MTPIRLFRDTDAPEKKEEIQMPMGASEGLVNTLTAIQNDAYNIAIDHATAVVQQYNTGKELSPLVTTIIEKLKSLKNE